MSKQYAWFGAEVSPLGEQHVIAAVFDREVIVAARHARIIELKTYAAPSTIEGATALLLAEHRDCAAIAVFLDVRGAGAAVAEELRDQDYPVRTFGPSMKPTAIVPGGGEYRSLLDQVLHAFKLKIERGELAIQPVPELLQELRALDFVEAPGAKLQLAINEMRGEPERHHIIAAALAALDLPKRWGKTAVNRGYDPMGFMKK
jgi:hypothetical protein